MRHPLAALKALLYLVTTVLITIVPYIAIYAFLWNLCEIGADEYGCNEGDALVMIILVLPLSLIVWIVYLILHGKKYILKTFHLIDKLKPIWTIILSLIIAIIFFVPIIPNHGYFSEIYSIESDSTYALYDGPSLSIAQFLYYGLISLGSH